MEIRKPKQEIIFANVLMCLLVVFIHISSSAVSALEKNSIQYLAVMVPWRLSAFVVQGFVFLSALKIFIKKEPVTNYKNYYISRIKTIIVPYIIWVVIYYVYFCNHGYFPFTLNHLLKNMALGTLVSPFYFIVVIVQFYALLPLWQWLYKRFNPIAILAFSLIVTILLGQFLPKMINDVTGGFSFAYNDRLFTTYFLYWSMGAICGIYYENFTTCITKKSTIIALVFMLFACIDIYLSFQVFVQGIYVPSLETIHILYCVSAILFTMAVGTRTKPQSIMMAINSISYPIYLAHCYVLIRINDILATQGINDIGKGYAIRFFTVYTITITGCLAFKWLKMILFAKKM
ncbi:MAG: acyltransferase [Lachnospiraceae bacterium]|nr:acyltransferase [Lachnospiraceae bacterium]